MKTKKTLRMLGATGVAALLTLFFTTAHARAGHDALFSTACDLESVADTLQCEFTNELKYTHRWAPCGIEKELFDAINALELCAGHVHESIQNQCGFEELRRHVCETRAAADRVKQLACRTRLSRRIHARIAQADRLLCSIESEIAEQARAFQSHNHNHGHNHGHDAHSQPVPTAPPAAIPQARIFPANNRGEAFRFFLGALAENRRRR